MLILGVLAIGQMVFIPGWLCLQALRFGTSGILQKIIYAMGLSLLLNYGLVVGLTLMHLYTARTVYVILIFEFILLLYLYVKRRVQGMPDMVQESFSFDLKCLPLLVISGIIILSFISYALANGTEVFRMFDAVVSWNRWATDWAHNIFPYKTAEYPQLIPANWSLTYVMIKSTDVQFFARALMPLFPLAITLLMADWTFRYQNKAGVRAILFYTVVMLYFYQPAAMIDGYVDIAVSFFGLLAYYMIYQVQMHDQWTWKPIFLAGLFAAAAALTKQAGLFVLAAYVGWSVWVLLKHHRILGREEAMRVIMAVLGVLVIAGSWYLVKEMQISRGADYSAIQLVTRDIFAGASLPQRLINAAVLLINLRGETGRLILILLTASFITGFSNRSNRGLMLLSLVYLIIWGLFFSYDTRNLTLIFPIAALIMARGVLRLSNRGAGQNKRKIIIKKPVFALYQQVLVTGLILLGIGIGSLNYTSSRLVNSQLEKQEQLGIASLNKLLYEYERKQGIAGYILSDYIFLPFLPELRDKTMYRQWPEGIYAALQQETGLGALLLSNPVLQQENINREASGRFMPIFTEQGYTLLILPRGLH